MVYLSFLEWGWAFMRHVNRTISITFVVAVIWFAFVLPAHSQVVVDSDFMTDENSMYHISKSKTQKQESTFLEVGTGANAFDKLTQYCLGKTIDNRYPKRICDGSYTNVEFEQGYLTAKCTCTSQTQAGGEVTGIKVDTSVAAYAETSYSCPPDNHPYYTTTIGYSNGTNVCFDPEQLSDEDTCPVNPTDPDFILPSGTNTAPNVCAMRDDGSYCAFTNTGEGYYVPDLESNCYQNPQEEYADSQITPSPDEGQCVTDSGFLICTETPDNMCQGDTCYEGCGTVESQGQTHFVCYTNDTDGDTIPDYADPDIDGDGIANNEDLDSDGDGFDDPQYPDNDTPQSEEITVNIDLSGVESLLSSANSKLNTTNSTLSQMDETLGEIRNEISTIGEVEEKEKGSITSEDDANQEIADIQAEYEQLVESIRTEMSGLLTVDVPEAGFYGCVDIIQFLGATKQTCFTNFHDELQIVSVAFLFIFAVISIAILLR